MKGIIAVSGKAYADICLIRETIVYTEPVHADDPEAEIKRLNASSGITDGELSVLADSLRDGGREEQADILEFQRMLLLDDNYFGKIMGIVRDERVIAEYAVSKCSAEYREELLALDNEYLNERAADIKDIEQRLLKNLNKKGEEKKTASSMIAVAVDLTPSEVVELSHRDLKGIILEKGGLSSHCVILARSFGIPCMVGVTGAVEELSHAGKVLLDAVEGRIIADPSDSEVAAYHEYVQQAAGEREALEAFKHMRTETADHRKMGVYANITSPEETAALLDNGGEGVGLLRTEMLYMERSSAPSVDAQYKVYEEIARDLEGRPLILRTLDVGGDKKIAYLGIGEEENPFLGYRAIRYCLEHEEIFRAQIEAALRASAYGNLKIMLPMISTIEELRKARAMIDDVREKLVASGVSDIPKAQVGVMVETPAAALMADRFAQEADFFSIGTNDLTQYTFAADRNNEKVAHLSSYFEPALLRLVSNICKQAGKNGIEVDICGQAGEVDELIPLWVGMGVDNLSVSIPSIMRVRRTISRCDYKKCKELVDEILDLSTQDEVREVLRKERGEW